ncbi:MAG: TonB-dependent receptor [Wenzhouxiangella sp.]|nr:TonB-dependent receptor [Wenzhouxiangella sp.]
MLFVRLYCTTLLALGLNTLVLAESPADQEDGEALDTIVVTAERGRARLAMEIPQSVSTVSRESLDASVPIDLTDAIRRQPSVSLGPAGEALNFWQQGFTLRGLGSQRVLTLTNGVRLSGQGTGYGGGNISLYDTFSVERVEILRGPNSVLHGTDALGGVINVITRQPAQRSEPGISGGLGYSHDSAWSLNRLATFIDAGNERGGMVIGASASSNDNPKRPDGTRADSGATDKTSGFFRAALALDDRHRLELFGDISRDEDVEVADSAIPFGPVGSGPIRFQFPLYQRSQLGADWRFQPASPTFSEWRMTLNWQQIRREFDRTAPEAFFAPPPPRIESVRIVTDDRVDTLELSPQLRLSLGQHLLTVGLDLGRDRSTGPETETREQLFPFAPPAPGFNPGPSQRQRVDARQTRTGLYLQNNWIVSPRLEWISGLRFDRFSVDDEISGLSRTENGMSGNLAVVFTPGDQASLYANLGRGFRAPDLAERFQRAVVAVVETVEQIGNPELDPERSWSLDLGSKWQRGTFSGEAAVFYNHVEDYIGEVDISQQPRVIQTANLREVDLYGWELSAAWQLAAWELFANASRTYAPGDRDIVRVDRGRLNYGLAYRLTGPFSSSVRIELLGRSVRSSSDQTGPETIDFKGFTLFDLRGHIDIPLQGEQRLRLLAGIRNLTDKAYREPFFNQLQPERSLIASMQYFF